MFPINSYESARANRPPLLRPSERRRNRAYPSFQLESVRRRLDRGRIRGRKLLWGNWGEGNMRGKRVEGKNLRIIKGRAALRPRGDGSIDAVLGVTTHVDESRMRAFVFEI